MQVSVMFVCLRQSLPSCPSTFFSFSGFSFSHSRETAPARLSHLLNLRQVDPIVLSQSISVAPYFPQSPFRHSSCASSRPWPGLFLSRRSEAVPQDRLTCLLPDSSMPHLQLLYGRL